MKILIKLHNGSNNQSNSALNNRPTQILIQVYILKILYCIINKEYFFY